MRVVGRAGNLDVMPQHTRSASQVRVDRISNIIAAGKHDNAIVDIDTGGRVKSQLTRAFDQHGNRVILGHGNQIGAALAGIVNESGRAVMNERCVVIRVGADCSLDIEQAGIECQRRLLGSDIGGAAIGADGTGLPDGGCHQGNVTARIGGSDLGTSLDVYRGIAVGYAVNGKLVDVADNPASAGRIAGSEQQIAHVNHRRRTDDYATRAVEPYRSARRRGRCLQTTYDRSVQLNRAGRISCQNPIEHGKISYSQTTKILRERAGQLEVDRTARTNIIGDKIQHRRVAVDRVGFRIRSACAVKGYAAGNYYWITSIITLCIGNVRGSQRQR